MVRSFPGTLTWMCAINLFKSCQHTDTPYSYNSIQIPSWYNNHLNKFTAFWPVLLPEHLKVVFFIVCSILAHQPKGLLISYHFNQVLWRSFHFKYDPSLYFDLNGHRMAIGEDVLLFQWHVLHWDNLEKDTHVSSFETLKMEDRALKKCLSSLMSARRLHHS